MTTFRITTRAAAAAMLLLAFGAQAQSRRANDPDLKEIRDYRLSMDVLQKYVAAAKATTADPAVAKCFGNESPGDAKTLDLGEKRINGCLPAVADLKGAGLKPREFLIITAALIGDVMAVGMKKSGTIQQYPPSISPENAAFVEQNYDKIQAMLNSLSKGRK